MLLTVVENPRNQVPFAVCGSSERGETDSVIVNTYPQRFDFGVRLFSIDVNVFSQGSAFVATATAVALAPDPLQGVREVVSAIKEARCLPTNQNFDELLKRAGASRGTPENIRAWAADLARKTGDLND